MQKKMNAVEVLKSAGFRAIVTVVKAVVQAFVRGTTVNAVVHASQDLENALVELARTGALTFKAPHTIVSGYGTLIQEVQTLLAEDARPKESREHLAVLLAVLELARCGQQQSRRDADELKSVTDKLDKALRRAGLGVEIRHAPPAGPSWNGRYGRMAHDQDGHGGELPFFGLGESIVPESATLDALTMTNLRYTTRRSILAQAARRVLTLPDSVNARAWVVLENNRHMLRDAKVFDSEYQAAEQPLLYVPVAVLERIAKLDANL